MASFNDILASVEYPDLSTGDASNSEQVKYTVDALGAQKTILDRNGTLHTYEFDALGRFVSDTASLTNTSNPNNVNLDIVKRTVGYDTITPQVYRAAVAGTSIATLKLVVSKTCCI